MTLLNPIWLWALAGLSIPIAIHLLSRKEGKTIRIGSTRFLKETATSKFSSIRLNEVVLLAIRSVLILLIVLFLATLLLPSSKSNVSQKWVLVEKELEDNDRIKKLLDSLQKDGYEVRRLSENFPLPKYDIDTQSPDYYRLSEDLSQRNVQAIVIAGNILSNFKGKQIPLPTNITWLSYPVSSEYLSGDSILLNDTLRVTLASDQKFQYDKKIMMGALRVVQSAAPLKVVVEDIDVKNFKSVPSGWLIWLSDNDFNYTGKSLRFREVPTSSLIVQESKSQWLITKRLTEGNAIEQHLTVQLISVLLDEKTKQEIRKHDKRTMSDELAWSKSNSSSTTIHEAGLSADKILILLISLLFTAERILAFYRKQ